MRWIVAWVLIAVPFGLGGCPFDLTDDDAGVAVLTSSGDVTTFDADGTSVAWSSPVGSVDFGDLLVDGGTVYVQSGGSTVLALDGADGSEVWAADIGGSAVGQLAILDDTLFVQTADDVVALDADSGAELWSESFAGLSGAMATGEGALFVAGNPVRRLDVASGAEDASFDLGDPFVPGIGVTGGRVVVGGRYDVVSLMPGDLAEDWVQPLDDASCTGLAVDSGDVYVSTDNIGLFGYDAGDPTPFMQSLDDSALDPPAVAGGLVYVTESFGDLFAIDPASGEVSWSWDSSAEHRGGLAVRGTTLYLADGSALVGIDADAGTASWEQSPGGTIVAVAVF
ncbi:MAG: PQQ-binding-like beta-propeller repeat protein [Myxococcota bacterium]|nr:PQQ-binding-like beta-propeller repeat protein [Myxococcota bacterium]